MLHYYFRVYFYGFILFMIYNCVYFYGYFLYMLHVCVYCYLSMNLCIYIMYLFDYVLYIKLCNSSVCICFNCMQFGKFMWHSLVGCSVCYSMFRKEKGKCSLVYRGLAWVVGDVTIWDQSFNFQH
jgi:hypothetical protein